MRSRRASFRDSQASGPIVAGLNRNRYELRRRRPASARASAHSSTIPERLSLQSDGWQMYVDSNTSLSASPSSRSSP